MAPTSIAVLGGGLTGLSAAFYLTRRFPTARIAVYNAEARFGGWVRSDRVRVSYTNHDGKLENADVVLEAGPRTLRPNARSVLELIHLLNLSPTLLTVPKSSHAARSRFLYIPEYGGLCRLPSAPLDFLSPSRRHIGRLLLSSVAREPFKRRNRRPGLDDESVDDFVARRFGSEWSRIFASSLVHGIYAADARRLSLRSAFPSLWEAEERGNGSVVSGILRRSPPLTSVEEPTSYELGHLQDTMRDVSVYSFREGIGTLTNALVKYLREHPNVSMYGGVRITGLRINPRRKQFELITTAMESVSPTHVVSTLPLFRLHGLLTPAIPLPHLTANTYTSVTVVNLVFPRPPSSSSPLHPEGFGYLVPRPPDGYFNGNNRLGILGCVFDSSSTAAQDSSDAVVKMTIMLGGPYVSCSLPQVNVPNLLSELSTHLGRTLPEPILVKVHHNQHCIPLYSVGHSQRMEELEHVLASEPWAGRMEVIGAGVGGVSVGDCVEAGRNAGRFWS
ncbi:hypothetical protein EDC04DRAFT_2673375 [Pisolithus marmoratus]|nr:hypothetical protein EDC04DRAFT_2673375 [Pisolithus marmoratus]